MGQDLRTDERLVARATETALAAAAARGVTSAAFPALGTGVGGLPIARCAAVMLDAVRRQAAASSLERVIFVLFGESAYREFAAVAARMLGGECGAA